MDANYYDVLTGLPTMTCFFENSSDRKEEIVKNGSDPAVIFLTLHGMRNYNQKNGFVLGNEFLKTFSEVFGRYFKNENCCRLGGVHFAAIVAEKGVEEKISKFIAEWDSSYSNGEVFVHAGVYLYKIEDVNITVASDRAKLACDDIKSDRSSCVNYYSQSIRHAEENHRYILDNLNRAISERWITAYYQPIVRALNGKVCDEEVLARWIDPVKGFLSPADFIPILEQEKLIYKLDLYIVERAIEKMKYFESLGVTAVSHSINLSRSDFECCDMVEEIRTRVDLAGISRSKLNIEITESVIGNDFEFMKKQIMRFKELGFSVWMDDFGSGYSSLNVLKEIPFDLIKFDMSFMKEFEQNNNGKVILAELMKMAFAIGVDTVCEGVETENQLQFLREIGCSKIQGFYYCKPIPTEQILERMEKKQNIGFENLDETKYFETVGRVNLHDLAVISYGNESDFNNIFNMTPMAVLELTDETIRYVRTNQSYRNFFQRYFNTSISMEALSLSFVEQGAGLSFITTVKNVAKNESRSFVDAVLPDGSVATYFVRRLTDNPVTKAIAIAIGVLYIRDASQSATYENIAKALSADYFRLFYVNLETEDYVGYTSSMGEETLSMERHGKKFFEDGKKDALQFVYEEDKKAFSEMLDREKIMHALDEKGKLSFFFRLIQNDEPVYVNLKIVRMLSDSKHVILGISNIDSQMKQKIALDKAKASFLIYNRLSALADDFLAMYVVDPETSEFEEFSASDEYKAFGIEKKGFDFFSISHKNAERVLVTEDVEEYNRVFTKENVMREVREKGSFTNTHHIVSNGKVKLAAVRATLVNEDGKDKLIFGFRLPWGSDQKNTD